MSNGSVRGRFPVALVMVLSATSCRSDERAASNVVDQDSAGIRVVESRAALWDLRPELRWQLSRRPVLAVGGPEDSATAIIHPILSAVRLNDGSIVAAGENSVIVWLNDRGEYRFRRGGRGKGPEEFQYIGALFHIGHDSIAVVDQGRRMSTFDGAGTRRDELKMEHGRLYRIQRTADGAWLGWSTTEPQDIRFDIDGTFPGYYRAGITLLRYVLDRASPDTIGHFPTEYRRVRQPSSHSSANELVAEEGPSFLLLTTQASFAVWNGSIVVGDAATHEITVLADDGRPVKHIRWHGEDLRIRERDHDKWRASIVAAAQFAGEMPVAVQRRQMAERLKSVEFAPRKAAYSTLVPDAAGNLWIQRLTPQDGPQQFTILDRDGVLLGNLDLPESFRATHLGDDFVLGVWTDSMDLQHIHLYEIDKPRPTHRQRASNGRIQQTG